MKNKKITINTLIIISSIVIVGLLCYILFFNKTDKYFKIIDNDIKIKIGSTKVINYFLSDNNLNIEWSSSNNDIIVNSNGELTANNYGSAVITGKVIVDDNVIINTCLVTAYSGDFGVTLQDIYVPSGYLLMMPNSSYDIPFTIVPNNSQVTSINYFTTDENVISVEDNKIISKNVGTVTLKVEYNDYLTKEILIKVSNEAIQNKIVDKAEKVILSEELSMEMGDRQELLYEIEPKDSYVENVEWISSNEDIVSITDGIIETKNIGEATVKVIINNEIEASMRVIVKSSNANILINSNPKTLIKVGDKETIKASIIPEGINDTIVYKSSNPSIVKVDNGIITGVSAGSATISLSISNGKTKTYNINVLPRSGSIKGSANLWGYNSLNDKVPTLANLSFFIGLAQSGVGIIQNNNYIVSSGNTKFTYDINSSILSVNGKRIKMRIFYPKGVDLSTTNTLTFMGGRGETNFDGFFKKIEQDPSIVKSSGILILVAEGQGISFDGDAGAYATMFVKTITKQKNNVKNSILGFSDGAHKVMHASNKIVYDKIIVFSGYTDGVESLVNAKNSEVMFIIAPNDGNYTQAQHALRNMKTSGYTNVTIISNGTDMIDKFADKFLVITPGTLMKNAHDTINVLNSRIISYAND